MTDQIVDQIVKKNEIQLGTMAVATPSELIASATAIAKELSNIVNDRKLYTNISGKKYVRVEGWSTMGAMLGVLPREKSIVEHDNGDFEATVELIRASDGCIIGQGSAIVGSDEQSWSTRPRYARRSMALTRATGKAFRLGFSWIMSLAGYEVTPAEEIEALEGEFREEQPRQQAKTTAQPAHKTSERPYPPEVVKDGLTKMLKDYSNFTPSDKQLNLLRYGLELLFDGDPAVTDKRHCVLYYLTGHASTKDISGPWFKVITEKWLKMAKNPDGSGEYVVDKMAVLEAQAIVAAQLVSEGQKELPV